ncbi:MAG TPA: hypothetical protein PK919_02315 [Candidatus Aminicenantes bacterium]|nr:hypothetical protein [Candidatus Aminicenantes bacterium]
MSKEKCMEALGKVIEALQDVEEKIGRKAYDEILDLVSVFGLVSQENGFEAGKEEARLDAMIKSPGGPGA